MSGSPKDVAAAVLAGLALVAGVIEFFYVPFAFGLLGVLLLLIAVVTSPRYRALYSLGAVVLGVGFVVGVTIATVAERALY